MARLMEILNGARRALGAPGSAEERILRALATLDRDTEAAEERLQALRARQPRELVQALSSDDADSVQETARVLREAENELAWMRQARRGLEEELERVRQNEAALEARRVRQQAEQQLTVEGAAAVKKLQAALEMQAAAEYELGAVVDRVRPLIKTSNWPDFFRYTAGHVQQVLVAARYRVRGTGSSEAYAASQAPDLVTRYADAVTQLLGSPRTDRAA